jgi:hypothetical protein
VGTELLTERRGAQNLVLVGAGDSGATHVAQRRSCRKRCQRSDQIALSLVGFDAAYRKAKRLAFARAVSRLRQVTNFDPPREHAEFGPMVYPGDPGD